MEIKDSMKVSYVSDGFENGLRARINGSEIILEVFLDDDNRNIHKSVDFSLIAEESIELTQFLTSNVLQYIRDKEEGKWKYKKREENK